ncbi:MAG: M67 family metallopeptidase [Chloroflexi bacterium]|nr:M67 family metallopeptidase [Chloroflexota bacterium]
MALILPSNLYSQISAHLEAAYPNEGAGILIGAANGESKTAQAIRPFANNFESGEQYHRYLITAQDMLDGEMEAERLGLDVIGVFHSHPDHPAQASEYDREYALPWYSYLIVSVQKGKAANARSWVLSDDRSKFNEETFQLAS